MSSVYFSSSTSAVDKDDGTVNIAVTCSPAAPAGGCSVHYATEDVTANSTTYGMGKNYTSTSGTLSFSEGETSKNITVTIINNSLFFPDITFTVTLSSPVNCTLGGTTENICTIQDSLAPFVLTVDDSDGSLTDIDHASWACAGDGVTDDRANFQNILDYLKANGGGVAHIPSGLTILIGTYTQVADYFIGMWMPCRQQITISGEGSSNSIILAGIKSGLTQYHLLECGRQYGRGSPSTDYWYGADIGL